MDLRQHIDRQGRTLGLSVPEMARRCGMPASSLHRLRRERGNWDRFPELRTFSRLSQGLELPQETLFVAAGVSCELVQDGSILSGQPHVSAQHKGALMAVIPVGYRTEEEIERVRCEISAAITWVMGLLNYRDNAVLMQASLG